jgi:hypothetical protein
MTNTINFSSKFENMRTVENILQTGRNITPNTKKFTLAMSMATIY